MMSLRKLLRPSLPPNIKRSLQRIVLGYHSYAPSFSSAGEDMILRHLLGPDKRDGFYVDVGAFHPVYSSNTYFFYLYGWRGINIEPRPGSKALFDRIRPQDINLEMGVAGESRELTYYFVGEESSMNSFSRDFLEQLNVLNQVKKEIPVPVLPLTDVLSRYLPPGTKIDFMNVDVEGYDLEVLKSNDWDLYRPHIVIVEDKEVVAEQSDIVRLMKLNSYELCAQNAIILGKLNEYFFIDSLARSAAPREC